MCETESKIIKEENICNMCFILIFTIIELITSIYVTIWKLFNIYGITLHNSHLSKAGKAKENKMLKNYSVRCLQCKWNRSSLSHYVQIFAHKMKNVQEKQQETTH